MNVEDYEAELKRVKERRQKQLEKSLNNSKSDASFELVKYDSPENERIMKRSDPMRRPPTPEIVKRYQARINRYKETGRYSWESPDESENVPDDSRVTDKAEDIPLGADVSKEVTVSNEESQYVQLAIIGRLILDGGAHLGGEGTHD